MNSVFFTLSMSPLWGIFINMSQISEIDRKISPSENVQENRAITLFHLTTIPLDDAYINAVESKLLKDTSEHHLGDSIPSVFETIIRMKENECKVAIHSIEVAWVVRQMGKLCNLSNREIDHLTLGGLLHDTGQIHIPDLVNLKRRFTPEEKAAAEKHTQFGYDYLRQMNFPETVQNIALEHHTSYKKLAAKQKYGERESWLIRIATIADGYAALRGNRPHQITRTNKEALQIITQINEDEKYDPKLFGMLLTFGTAIENNYPNTSLIDLAVMSDESSL